MSLTLSLIPSLLLILCPLLVSSSRSLSSLASSSSSFSLLRPLRGYGGGHSEGTPERKTERELLMLLGVTATRGGGGRGGQSMTGMPGVGEAPAPAEGGTDSDGLDEGFAPTPEDGGKMSKRKHRKKKKKTSGGAVQRGAAGSSGGLNQAGIIDLNNKYRAEVGSGSMSWDEKYVASAQQWADYLASSSCSLVHSTSGDYAENLAGPFPKGTSDPGSDAMVLFYGEKPLYRASSSCDNGDPNGSFNSCCTTNNFESCGHYYNMIAASTTKVGCAPGTCADGGIIIVCHYNY